MGKVFHVSDDVHATVKEFCVRHEMDATKIWVERVLLWAVKNNVIDPGISKPSPAPRVDVAPPPRVDAAPVKKKDPPPTEPDRYGSGPKPWEKPPFWDTQDPQPAPNDDNPQAIANDDNPKIRNSNAS